jgi:hypothetical protein
MFVPQPQMVVISCIIMLAIRSFGLIQKNQKIKAAEKWLKFTRLRYNKRV